MSDTKRTDALRVVVQDQNWGYRDMVLHAEKLERELNALRAAGDDLLKSCKHIGWTSCEDGRVIREARDAVRRWKELVSTVDTPPAGG